MDKEHLNAVNTLKSLLEPFTDDICHLHNIELARLTFPFNTIPISSPPEEWKPIVTEEFLNDRYIVSSWGRIFDIKHNHYLYSHLCDKGYVRIGLMRISNNNYASASCSVRTHRLVADAFIPHIEGKDTVNHIDTIKTNNTIANLEWVTNLENLEHARVNGCLLNRGGYKYFTHEQIIDIRERHKNGQKMKDIATIYGRQFRSISFIVNNKAYDDSFWENLGYYSNKHYGQHPK